MQKENTGPNPQNKNNKNNKTQTQPKRSSSSKKRKRKHSADKKVDLNNPALQLLPKHGVKTPHSSLPELKVKRVKEPLVTCSYCGKTIDNIASAIHPDEDSFFHFDCMIEKLTEQEELLEGEKISYIGRGTFAIVTKNEENNIIFRKTIEVEKNEAFSQMKKYIEGTKI